MMEQGVQYIKKHYPILLVDQWQNNFQQMENAIANSLVFCESLQTMMFQHIYDFSLEFLSSNLVELDNTYKGLLQTLKVMSEDILELETKKGNEADQGSIQILNKMNFIQDIRDKSEGKLQPMFQTLERIVPIVEQKYKSQGMYFEAEQVIQMHLTNAN